ncbi:MAG: ATP-grasp domain-containing protein [Asticcacaulis sp.]|nr:ATP-grasp domain-containing protein [Asticcacaulis sp.]
MTLARTPAEAKAQADALGFSPPPLIQDFIAGDDYCVAALADEGRLQAIMAYKNLSTFPRKAGAGAIRESVDETPFREAVSQLLAATGWNGVCEIDFRWTGNGTDVPQVIEINARFWAGIFHSIETGVDFPWLLFLQTIGVPFAPPQPHIGVVTKTPAVWLLATVEEVAASDPHLASAADAWARARNSLSTGKFVEAMESAAAALGTTASAREVVDALSAAVDKVRGAQSELSSDKDPLVGLGALFILSHLVRHRRLPPEVTYQAEVLPAPIEATARRRPTIGITKPDHGDLPSWWAMKFAVWLAGGRAVKLTSKAPGDPRTIDALIFGGGSDIYPLTYAGKPKAGYRYDLARGDLEASWAASAREHDLPVLGVCRGAQMLNVFAGGTLHADHSGFEQPVFARGLIQPLTLRKPIRIKPDSLLHRVMTVTKARVNAIHCQSIDRLGAGLTVTAREPNGTVQGVEDRTRRFWVGVQFHPELMIYRKRFRNLFSELVRCAAERARE